MDVGVERNDVGVERNGCGRGGEWMLVWRREWMRGWRRRMDMRVEEENECRDRRKMNIGVERENGYGMKGKFVSEEANEYGGRGKNGYCGTENRYGNRRENRH